MKTLLQAVVSGYKGLPACLFAILDGETGAMLVVKEAAQYSVNRKDDHALVTTDALCDDFDVRFTEESIQDAVKVWQEMSDGGTLILSDALNKHNPSGKIEYDGIDLRGRMYRLDPTITNGIIAVLALCWFADRQKSIQSSLDVFDELLDIQTLV
jgi:hypothetical protein